MRLTRRGRALAARLAPGRAAGPPPVAVVYTSGKVGSSAVSQALARAGLVTHHIHTLRRAALIRDAGAALAEDRLPLRHVSVAMAERARLVGGQLDARYVSLVRDPLGRTLAAFFENLHRRRDGLSRDSDPGLLFETYLAETDQFYGLTWFDREFRDELGIDVMAAPFDRARRMTVLPGGRTAIFRIDCETALKERTLGRLFGRRVRIGPANVGAEKPYAAAYAAVLDRARFPADLIERIYSSPFVCHFWTDAERDALARRWSGG